MSAQRTIIGDMITIYNLTRELTEITEFWAQAEQSSLYPKPATCLHLDFVSAQVDLRMFYDLLSGYADQFWETYWKPLRLQTERLDAVLVYIRSKVQQQSQGNPQRLQWTDVSRYLEIANQALTVWMSRAFRLFNFLPSCLKDDLEVRRGTDIYAGEQHPLVALNEHTTATGALSEALSSSTELFSSVMKEEPRDVPKEGVYYWKELIQTSESIRIESYRFQKAKFEIVKLFHVLRSADAEQTSIPKAELLFQHWPHTFGIAYIMPEHFNPIPGFAWMTPTLREMIRMRPEHALNERLRIAIGIVRAVLFLHDQGRVHKSIQPENILLVYNKGDKQPPRGLGSPILVGHTQALQEDAQAMSDRAAHTELWQCHLFSNPERLYTTVSDVVGSQVTSSNNDTAVQKSIDHRDTASDASSDDTEILDDSARNASGTPIRTDEAGSAPSEEDDTWIHAEQMQSKLASLAREHDVFALGVVLLELGCWENFCEREELRNLKRPERRRWLHDYAGLESRLAHQMGTRYADIVLRCFEIPYTQDTAWDAKKILNRLEMIQM